MSTSEEAGDAMASKHRRFLHPNKHFAPLREEGGTTGMPSTTGRIATQWERIDLPFTTCVYYTDWVPVNRIAFHISFWHCSCLIRIE